jgi:hypothetical protein
VAVLEDQSPRGYLDFLAPKGAFTVVEKRGRTFVDPRSYARYDGLAEAVASLDTAGCARVYRQLEPLFEAASRELGVSEGGFSNALARASRKLLETPEPQGDVAVKRVVSAVVVYEYADPKLEALTPAQKHLLRLGPANARQVKAKLRELTGALDLVRP